MRAARAEHPLAALLAHRKAPRRFTACVWSCSGRDLVPREAVGVGGVRHEHVSIAGSDQAAATTASIWASDVTSAGRMARPPASTIDSTTSSASRSISGSGYEAHDDIAPPRRTPWRRLRRCPTARRCSATRPSSRRPPVAAANGHHTLQPPSTTRFVPWTNDDPSDARRRPTSRSPRAGCSGPPASGRPDASRAPVRRRASPSR